MNYQLPNSPSAIFFSSIFFVMLISCRPEMKKVELSDKNSNNNSPKNFNEDSLKNLFIKVNQQVIVKENDEMDVYAKQHKLPFVKTNSGLRYYVYKPSEKGDSIKSGMQITMAFKVKLFDGTTVYSSKELGKKTFSVEHENLESGIQRGVQFLKRGDKAIFLIPSHSAHGLLGDMDKIPPQVPIIYEVQID
jgi:FKBP-type peptidyl-prolyl cis-trans isomerase FkpA